MCKTGVKMVIQGGASLMDQTRLGAHVCHRPRIYAGLFGITSLFLILGTREGAFYRTLCQAKGPDTLIPNE